MCEHILEFNSQTGVKSLRTEAMAGIRKASVCNERGTSKSVKRIKKYRLRVSVLALAMVFLLCVYFVSVLWVRMPHIDGELYEPRCLPFTHSEIFATARIPANGTTCYKNVRVQACLILQTGGSIPRQFDCKSKAADYLSAASIALRWKWEEIQSKVMRTRQTVEIRKTCALSSDCDECRRIFMAYAVIDVRLHEESAFKVIHSCLSADGDSLASMYRVFSAVSSNLPAYETLRERQHDNFEDSQIESGVFQSFKSPFCTPQHFCEPLKVAVEYLNDNTKHVSCLQENEDRLLGRMYTSGLGSSLHIASNDAIVATHFNASYILSDQEEFNWADVRDCDPAVISCYYNSFGTKCPYGDNSPTSMNAHETTSTFHRALNHSFLINGKIRADHGPALETFVESVLARTRCFNDPSCEESKQYFRRSGEVGRRIFARAASANFFQQYLRQEVHDLVEQGIDDLRVSHPIMSIHVRRGDKQREMTMLDLEDYLQYAIPICLGFGVRNIFLSTEDPDVVARAFVAYSSFNWIVTDDIRQNPDFEGFMRANKTREFLSSMKNLYAAAECDFFVGARASNWCRLIDETKRFNGLGGTYYIDAHGQRENTWEYAGA